MSECRGANCTDPGCQGNRAASGDASRALEELRALAASYGQTEPANRAQRRAAARAARRSGSRGR